VGGVVLGDACILHVLGVWQAEQCSGKGSGRRSRRASQTADNQVGLAVGGSTPLERSVKCSSSSSMGSACAATADACILHVLVVWHAQQRSDRGSGDTHRQQTVR
jgi:hypothetical protein